jgi:hypothetical protein
MSWAKYEINLFKKLNTPEKIQKYLDDLEYNSSDSCLSPRYTILSQDAHCLEGALLAASILEFHGERPLILDFLSLDFDDPHVVALYKYKNSWGSIGKSSTTFLSGRSPVYKSVRELAMSYFDFYFDKKGRKSLVSFSDPINLNVFNRWNWRITEIDLLPMGLELNKYSHYQIIKEKELTQLPKANKRLIKACFSV